MRVSRLGMGGISTRVPSGGTLTKGVGGPGSFELESVEVVCCSDVRSLRWLPLRLRLPFPPPAADASAPTPNDTRRALHPPGPRDGTGSPERADCWHTLVQQRGP